MTVIQMSARAQGYSTESPENKVSVLQAEANEVLSFAVFPKFLEINAFSPQRKKIRGTT